MCPSDAIFRQQISEKASCAASVRQGPTLFWALAIDGECDLRTSTLLMRGSFFLAIDRSCSFQLVVIQHPARPNLAAQTYEQQRN